MTPSATPWGAVGAVALAELGRRYRDDAPDEALLSERAALANGVRPGDVLRLKMLAPDEVLQFTTGFGEPDGPAVELRITGLMRLPGPLIDPRPVLASPAFPTRHPDALTVGDVTYLRLTDGARSIPSVQQEVDRLGAQAPPTDSPVPTLQFLRPDDGEATAQATARVLTRGLFVFALVAGGVGLIRGALAFVRYHSRGAADQRIEAALGLTRAERVTARVLAGGLSAVVATLATVGGALAMAGLDPQGPLKRFEPDPDGHPISFSSSWAGQRRQSPPSRSWPSPPGGPGATSRPGRRRSAPGACRARRGWPPACGSPSTGERGGVASPCAPRWRASPSASSA